MLNIGDNAPDFSLPNQQDEIISISNKKGKWLVVYFYPKDNTPGCTLEGISFTALAKEFYKLDTEIIGISRDSTSIHKKFIEKNNLNVNLLSDPDKKTHEKYEVWKLKKNYGKESMGTERSTFLITPDGKIAKCWRKVKVNGHAEEVLEELKKFKNNYK